MIIIRFSRCIRQEVGDVGDDRANWGGGGWWRGVMCWRKAQGWVVFFFFFLIVSNNSTIQQFVKKLKLEEHWDSAKTEKWVKINCGVKMLGDFFDTFDFQVSEWSLRFVRGNKSKSRCGQEGFALLLLLLLKGNSCLKPFQPYTQIINSCSGSHRRET